MWEEIILLAIYVVFGLTCLAVAGWGVVTGQFLDIDGLFLVLACLSLAVVFLAAFGLSVWRGEFADLLNRLRRPKSPAPAQSSNPRPDGNSGSAT